MTLPSAEEVATSVRTGKKHEGPEIIRAYRNWVLEAAAKHFEDKRGGPYGSASVAAEIRKLKEEL